MGCSAMLILLPYCLDGPFSQAIILVSFPHSASSGVADDDSRLLAGAPASSLLLRLFQRLAWEASRPACPEDLSNAPVLRCFARHELSLVLLTYPFRHHRGNGYVAN